MTERPSCQICPDRYCIPRGEGFPGRLMMTLEMGEFPRRRLLYTNESVNECITRKTTIFRALEDLKEEQEKTRESLIMGHSI